MSYNILITGVFLNMDRYAHEHKLAEWFYMFF